MSAATTSTSTVLFVDDEERVLTTLRRMLWGEPFKVLIAVSAQQALEILETRTVDIIVSDERMPGMRGSDLLVEVKRLYPDICRIMLTGHASLEASIHAINSGRIFRFLLKPVSKEDLLEALRNGLAERQQQRRLLSMSQRAGNVCSFEIKIDKEGKQVYTRWSENARDMLEPDFGQSLDTLDILFDRVHPEDLSTARRGCYFCLENHQCPAVEYRIIMPDGRLRWVLQTSDTAIDADDCLRLLSVLSDISERKKQQEQLEYQAFHDNLTGLGNRARLQQLLAEKLKTATGVDKRVALLFIDLDNFKLVNDSLGHSFGDLLLQSYAGRLTSLIPPESEAIRLGGDEFAVILHENETGIFDLADSIQQAMESPFNIDKFEIIISNSIGIAFSSCETDSAPEILRNADTAMYAAKSSGKNTVRVFNSEMHDKAARYFKMTGDMRKGLTLNEFFLLFQPIVELDSLNVAGYEALLRWQHPEEGLIMPEIFIPVAEESSLIIPLGEKVMEMACAQAGEWALSGAETLPFISFNVSIHQLRQIDFIERMNSAMKSNDLNPHQLKIEITESGVMEDVETSLKMLNDLKTMKLRLQIDDFGTGYSSLSYLQKIPADNIKIDRSFVDGMEEDTEKQAIVRTIITLAHSLGMDVVAEGIETTGQLRHLQKLGCRYGQGFLFDKPLDRIKAFAQKNYSHVLK